MLLAGKPGYYSHIRPNIGAGGGEDYIGGNRNILWIQIAHIRDKIQWDSSLPPYIVTIRGIGYRFEPHFDLMRENYLAE